MRYVCTCFWYLVQSRDQTEPVTPRLGSEYQQFLLPLYSCYQAQPLTLSGFSKTTCPGCTGLMMGQSTSGLLVLPTRAGITRPPLPTLGPTQPPHPPTKGPEKQQAALLWLLQLSKQPLWAVVPVWAPRQSKSPQKPGELLFA